MNRLLTFVGVIFTCIYSVKAQELTLLQKLPNELRENSGMANYGDSIFYFHNDSGHPNDIYRYHKKSKTLEKFTVPEAINVDWEEMAQDSDGNLYIGDFGNNANSRKDLKIYKINNPEKHSLNNYNVEVIRFSYARQREFAPSKNERHYDMEAMFWFKDSLYLFSKNRTEPYDGKCYMYVLPAKVGTYTLSPVDSFLFPAQDYRLGWITAADISPDGKMIALLSSHKMHIFIGDFDQLSFFQGEYLEVDFNHLSQKEAIVFKKDGSGVFITDEENQIGPNLYAYNFETQTVIKPETKVKKKVFSDAIDFSGNSTLIEVYVYDLTGRLCYQKTTMDVVSLSFLPPQLYVVYLKSGNEVEWFKWGKM